MNFTDKKLQVVSDNDVDILKALGHSVRLRIVRHLMLNGERNVNQIKEQLGLPQSTVSLHLAKLRNTRVVKAERHGIEVHYQIANDKAKDIVASLLCS